MRYVKLNKNWNAEPNAPAPRIQETEDGITLNFLLNPFLFDYIDEGDKGSLEFDNVHSYRLGPTNDEGYMKGQFRYTTDQLPWGHFYELQASNWQADFPDDRKVLKPLNALDSPTHFIFFFRNQTFECIAEEFYYTYQNLDLEAISAKYPDHYMEHYLDMYDINHKDLSASSIKDHTEMYMALEGPDEFAILSKEVEQIQNNQDEAIFVKLGNVKEIVGFSLKDLNLIFDSIQNTQPS